MMDHKKSFHQAIKPEERQINGKKKWIVMALVVAALVILVAGVVFWRTGKMFNAISTDGNIFGSLVHVIPGVSDKLKGENEGRINILVMGMRGEGDNAGGLLADSLMVASLDTKNNKIALTSIPRDLYVDNIQNSGKSKINAIYAQGESKRKGGGIADMEKKISDITGISVNYSMVINHQGFKDVVNSLGGVPVHLDNAFSEPVQFMGEPKRCDSTTYTIPAGKDEVKTSKRKNGSIATRHYPLCYPKVPSECGGNFKVAAGDSVLNGDQALCFVRSRDTTSDFERAKRQQMVLQLIKDKALQLGTLTDFNKMNSLMESLGKNFQTDLQAWEMKSLYDLYMNMNKNNPEMIQHTLENSEEGLLYAPGENPETGYILLPRGDNYDRIKQLFQNVFTLTSQSNAKPKL